MIGPTAAPAQWPYTEHRNMQQVMRQERQAEIAADCYRAGDADDIPFATHRNRMAAGSAALLAALERAA